MKAEFFAGNRARLVEKLNGGIIVLSAYTAQQRRDDMSFKFEQESNFWYLTGIEYADWRLIIDGIRHKTWLIAPTVDAVHQVFDGSLDATTAKKLSGVDEVIDTVTSERLLTDLAKKHSLVYTLGESPYAKYYDFTLNPAQRKLREELDRVFASTRDCSKELVSLRAIKQPEEIAAIKRAVKLTCNTFDAVKSDLQTFKTEYEIEAEYTYRFRRAGADGHAYDPIVAAGVNACTLHYVANQDKLRKSSMVLIDIGARVGGYAADITRTYAYGATSRRAQQVHAAVVAAQRDIINQLGPDMPVEEYQRFVDQRMLGALVDLGLAESKSDIDALRTYMPHSIGHGLGADVHDQLGRPRIFQPGMVMTVEPGIYIPDEKIGVRIEDDILITTSGRENLSAKLSTDY